jgi:hypothetical protein
MTRRKILMRRKRRRRRTMERYLLKWQRLPKAVSKRWTISGTTMKSAQWKTTRTDCTVLKTVHCATTNTGLGMEKDKAWKDICWIINGRTGKEGKEGNRGGTSSPSH